MPYDSYNLDPSGAYQFVDSLTGQSILATGVEAMKHAQRLDWQASQAPPAPSPLVAPAPDAQAALAASPDPRMAALAMADQGGAGGAPAVASDVGAGGAPGANMMSGAEGGAGYDVAPVALPEARPALAPTATAGPAAAPPGRIIMGGRAAEPAPPPDNVQVLGDALIRQQLQGSPGGYRKGGTVQTGEQRVSQGGLSQETLGQLSVDMRLVEQAKQNVADAERAQQARDMTQRADIEAIYAQQAEKQRAESKARLDEIYARKDKLIRDVDAGEIDPERFWKTRTEGQKFWAFLGIALGAVGASLSKDGKNDAVAQLDEMTKRDIDAQKANLAKKKGQLSELGQLYQEAKAASGDDAVALNTARMAALQRFGTQAQALALQSNNPVAQRRAELVQNEVNLRVQQLYAENEQRQNASVTKAYKVEQPGYVGGKAPNLKAAFETAQAMKKAQDEKGAKPEGGIAYGGQFIAARPGVSEGVLTKAQTEVNYAQNLNGMLDDIEARSREPGGIAPGDPALKALGSLSSGTLSQLTGAGVPSTVLEAAISDASTPGPRQATALKFLRNIATRSIQFNIDAVSAGRKR